MADAAEEAMKVTALMEDLGVHNIQSQLAAPGREMCEVCGEAIPAARRAVVPSAVTCVTCQEIRELRARTAMPGGATP